MRALMKVLRQQPVGGYVEIAGQFLSECPPNAAIDDPHRPAPESERPSTAF
jgi:hypothetical protein